MKKRSLTLKRLEAPTPAAEPAPMFRLLDPPEEYDRHEDRMLAGALQLPPGETDVPLYWEHSHRDLDAKSRFPLGRALIVYVGGEPHMVPRFDLVDEVSRICAAKVDAGTIRSCSVGYQTLSATRNARGGEDVAKAELLEVSLTGIGAKRSAVRRGPRAGASLAPAVGRPRCSRSEQGPYPRWQGMQDMHNMFSGRALLEPLDNGRYPGMKWTRAPW